MARLPFCSEATADLPSSPGVYIFYDRSGKPLYVGKATDLRSRVRSYFSRGKDFRLVTAVLDDLATAIDFIVTRSAKEALLLENSLIKKHAPRLNIRLRDDKTYFSLMLDRSERWPRLRVVRKRTPRDVLYFGPYPSARACRQTIRYLSAIFPLRTCSDAVLNNRTRPCVLHEIGRCSAPCVGLVTPEDYEELTQNMIRFLKGQDPQVARRLEQQMLAAAEALEFERAAELRDRLAFVTTTLESPLVTRRSGIDRDVVGLHETESGKVAVCVLHVRDGQLESTSNFELPRYAESDELLSAFLGQFYGALRTVPPEILLPMECADPEVHREVLEERRGTAVTLRVPEKGEGLQLLELAAENARLSVVRASEDDARVRATLDTLAQRFDLRRRPDRIEAFDVSHLGGEDVVASRVVFVDGLPAKRLYRHYRLRGVQRNDDFAAMEEVLTRRLERGRQEGDLPDLIVIDGGAAQLARGVAVRARLGLEALDMLGLAKARSGAAAVTHLREHERVYLPGATQPIVLESSGPVVHLMERIRDEAHRFAITYNRRLRAKARIGSVLEQIPGIGRRRARALLASLGSLAQVKAASDERLVDVPGITAAVVASLRTYFAERGGTFDIETPGVE